MSTIFLLFPTEEILMSILSSGRISDSICVLKYLGKFLIRSNKSILNNISHSNFEFISMDIHSQTLQAFINKNFVLEFMCVKIYRNWWHINMFTLSLMLWIISSSSSRYCWVSINLRSFVTLLLKIIQFNLITFLW